MTPNDTGGLREATAQLERASALMVHSPEDYATFAACLETAVSEVRRVTSGSREELDRFRADLNRLNTLFRGAETFYRGWCALAAVSDAEPATHTICIQA